MRLQSTDRGPWLSVNCIDLRDLSRCIPALTPP